MAETETKPERKIIVVSGSTGKQGGSVINGLLKDSRFKKDYVIRGLTRHPDTPPCRELANHGVEFWKGDLSSPETLNAALKGASFFFLLTDPFDPTQSGDKEYEVGCKVVDELIRLKVPNLIFSTLPNCEKLSGGKWKVHHFTNKAKIEDYIRSHKDSFKTIQFVEPSFFYQNFMDLGCNDGKELCFCLPVNENTKIPALDICDLSLVVPDMIHNPGKTNGKVVPLFGEELTLKEYVKLIGEVIGIPTKFERITAEKYRKLNSKIPLVEELVDMYGWIEEYGVFGPNPPDSKYTRQLLGKDIKFTSFRAWLLEHKNDPKWGPRPEAAG